MTRMAGAERALFVMAKFLSPSVQQKEHMRDKIPGERRESLVIVVRVMVVVCVNRPGRRLAEHQLSVYLISTKCVLPCLART